jgi:hypothetical protein
MQVSDLWVCTCDPMQFHRTQPLKSSSLCKITLCRLFKGNWHFGGIYCFYLQGPRKSQQETMAKQGARSVQNNHRCENFESKRVFLEKLTSAQLVKEFSGFCWTYEFTALSIKASHLTYTKRGECNEHSHTLLLASVIVAIYVTIDGVSYWSIDLLTTNRS